MHFKIDDMQIVYMQLRTFELFLLYLIVLLITYTILSIFAVLFWITISSQENPTQNKKLAQEDSQLHLKKKQLSSIIKRFLFVSVYDFSLFQYANLVFMLLVLKIIVIALWLPMKNEVGSSNHRKNTNRAKLKKYIIIMFKYN